MKLVILESPFSGTSKYWLIKKIQQWLNIRYARCCVKDCLKHNESAIASHLLYTQPGILDDDIPLDRERGIAAGHAWVKVADKMVVFVDHGVSIGMEHGIKAAVKANVKIEYRSLGFEFKKCEHDQLFHKCHTCRSKRT